MGGGTERVVAAETVGGPPATVTPEASEPSGLFARDGELYVLAKSEGRQARAAITDQTKRGAQPKAGGCNSYRYRTPWEVFLSRHASKLF